VRRQHERLVASAEQRLKRQEQRVGAAVRDHDVVRVAANLILARELLEDRGA
jgi:hypothetical protein